MIIINSFLCILASKGFYIGHIGIEGNTEIVGNVNKKFKERQYRNKECFIVVLTVKTGNIWRIGNINTPERKLKIKI